MSQILFENVTRRLYAISQHKVSTIETPINKVAKPYTTLSSISCYQCTARDEHVHTSHTPNSRTADDQALGTILTCPIHSPITSSPIVQHYTNIMQLYCPRQRCVYATHLYPVGYANLPGVSRTVHSNTYIFIHLFNPMISVVIHFRVARTLHVISFLCASLTCRPALCIMWLPMIYP